MDDSYEVIGDEPPKKAKARPVAKPVPVARPVAKPKPADDGYEVVDPPPKRPQPAPAAGEYGLVAETPAKRPKAHLGYKRKLEGFEDGEVDVPFELRTRKPRTHRPLDDDDKLTSRLAGVVVLVVGTSMCGGGWLASSSPGMALSLVGGCGIGVLWLGLGLILFPVSPQALRAFRDHRRYDELMQVLPPAWKWWFWLTFAWLAAGVLLPRVLRRG
jgi:hypothetical protein